MNSLILRTLIPALTVLSSLSQAASYIQPDNTKEMFQLEKIPLQVDRIKELSKHLAVLASRPQDDSPLQRRASAQLLALSMRLDPTNQEALEINRKLQADAAPKAPDQTQIAKARARVRFLKRWLGSPDAGANANLLADYLGDATRVLDPNTMKQADTGNWAGVVPPLSKYRGGDIASADTPRPTPDMTEPEKVDETPPPAKPVGYHITKLGVRVPLLMQRSEKYRDAKDQFKDKTRVVDHLTIVPVGLNLTSHEKLKFPLAVSVTPPLAQYHRDNGAKKQLQESIVKQLNDLLNARHSKVPPHIASVSMGLETYAMSNRQVVVAPLALMLEASLADKPLRSDIHLCANIDAGGNLTVPANFWKYLGILRKSKTGGRLIVPKASAELLTQILVYGEPDFFTRWEIFAVENLDQALAFATKASSEKVAEASELFSTVQNLANKSDVTKIAVNRAVRKRLATIYQLSPNHLSAKILLIQGSGRRPMRLSPLAMAQELLPAIQKMNKALTEINVDKLTHERLKQIHDGARATIDPLERLVDRTQNELYQETLDHANDFRRLTTIARRISSRPKDSQTEFKKARSLHNTMLIENQALLEKAQQMIVLSSETP